MSILASIQVELHEEAVFVTTDVFLSSKATSVLVIISDHSVKKKKNLPGQQ